MQSSMACSLSVSLTHGILRQTRNNPPSYGDLIAPSPPAYIEVLVSQIPSTYTDKKSLHSDHSMT